MFVVVSYLGYVVCFSYRTYFVRSNYIRKYPASLMNNSANIAFVNKDHDCVTVKFICENLLSHSLEETWIMSGRYFSGNSLWTFFSASFSKNPWITHLLLSQNLLDKFLHHKMLQEHWSLLATILDLLHWPNLVYRFHHYCTVSFWTLPKCFFVSKQNFFCKKLIVLKGCILTRVYCISHKFIIGFLKDNAVILVLHVWKHVLWSHVKFRKEFFTIIIEKKPICSK